VQPVSGEPAAVWMGHHPPLYYALGAVLIAPVDTSDRAGVLQPNPHFQWDENGSAGWNVMLPIPRNRFPWTGTILALHLLRFFGILWGLLALVFVYRTVRRLAPGQPWAAPGAVALVGLNPSFIFMSSTIHHDVLLAALFSAGLYWCIRSLDGALSPGALLAIGLLVGAAGLTKLSGVMLAPVVVLALLMRPIHPREYLHRVGQIALVGATAAIVAGWWYARNMVLYGDPLGWQMFLTTHNHMVRPSSLTWGLFVHEFLAQLAKTFWGSFGYMHILLPAWIRNVAWGLTAVAFCGWFFWFGHAMRGHRPQRRVVVSWVLLVSAFALLFLAFVRFAAATLGAGHGRYLFAAAVTIGAALIVGLNGYLRWRYARAITFCW
jgi:4-amino-4-deoxy-L-arabinose transferase-like glycosyltransferase